MVSIAIVAILAIIAIPNYINYRNKGFCTQAERDADHISAAISDYYALGKRTALPDVSDLKIEIVNPATILGDPNTTITIVVADRTGRCPVDYQQESAYWDANNHFSKYIR